MNEPLDQWESALNQAIAHLDPCIVERAVVVDRAPSTQDLAAQIRAQTNQPTAAIASTQTQGRGQRGAKWHDGEAHTLAMSVAFESTLPAHHLAARAGLAALDTCARALPSETVRIRFPNDIIVRTNQGDRKLAGVLAEQHSGATTIGIGINVHQRARDFDPSIRDRATSLKMFHVEQSRIDLSVALLTNLSQWITADNDAVRRRWSQSDAVTGTRAAFISANQTYTGVVTHIDPLGSITLADGTELDVRLTRNAPSD
jgi:BirA family biotin operon repressor/biotin-[acetyl-CoA-carboxylase] ligase